MPPFTVIKTQLGKLLGNKRIACQSGIQIGFRWEELRYHQMHRSPSTAVNGSYCWLNPIISATKEKLDDHQKIVDFPKKLSSISVSKTKPGGSNYLQIFASNDNNDLRTSLEKRKGPGLVARMCDSRRAQLLKRVIDIPSWGLYYPVKERNTGRGCNPNLLRVGFHLNSPNIREDEQIPRP